jgi:hypothetical protein
VHSGTRHLTASEEILYFGLPFQVCYHSAADIVCSRNYGNPVFGYIQAQGEASAIDVGKSQLNKSLIQMGDV